MLLIFKRTQEIFNKIQLENRRPTWDEYFLLQANIAALRSEDPYTKVGCCAVRDDNSIISIGYNGPPKGINIDWSNREEKNKRTVHAEVNTLRYAGEPGKIKTIYITHSPCPSCLTVIAAYGIKNVVFQEFYHASDPALFNIAKEYGINLKQYGQN